jgi:hypothetical protein
MQTLTHAFLRRYAAVPLIDMAQERQFSSTQLEHLTHTPRMDR